MPVTQPVVSVDLAMLLCLGGYHFYLMLSCFSHILHDSSLTVSHERENSKRSQRVLPVETQGLGFLSSAASVGSSVARLVFRVRSQIVS